jgi:hypothetical protein
MEPHRHLTVRKRVRKALAETQFSTLNGLGAGAALGATAGGLFEEVRHHLSASCGKCTIGQERPAKMLTPQIPPRVFPQVLPVPAFAPTFFR